VTTNSVSVALCTYNGSRYIEEQLKSILDQSRAVAEIVVADDGSSDATVEIVRRVAAEYRVSGHPAVVRLLLGGGHGVTKNFERAIAACEHDLIALSDQDDIWTSGRLERQYEEFHARPALTLLFGDARLVDENGAPLSAALLDTLEVTKSMRQQLHAGNAFGLLLRRNFVTGSTVIFRRSLLQAALPIPQEWVHDEWLAVMAAATGQVDFLEFAVTDYRQHGTNEIGVRMPSIRNKVDRVLQLRGSRNRDLAIRSGLLAERLVSTVGGAKGLAAKRKSEFEIRRAEMPANRILRVPAIVTLAVRGSYTLYASQGRADIIRDLLQPV
jgi:glycosyltransferase involved in cell wall biosynthesis